LKVFRFFTKEISNTVFGFASADKNGTAFYSPRMASIKFTLRDKRTEYSVVQATTAAMIPTAAAIEPIGINRSVCAAIIASTPVDMAKYANGMLIAPP